MTFHTQSFLLGRWTVGAALSRARAVLTERAASIATAANDDVPARDRNPPIFDVVTGSAADILMLMFGPPQHDNHVMRWRWHLHQRRFPR